jgi:transcriptional regulator with XRE-family HTH domain
MNERPRSRRINNARPNFSIRQLRCFVTVAEERHFRRAAERLHISQPPLTQAIQAIEADLGIQLFARRGNRIELTEGGELMLPEARAVLAQVDRLRDMALRAGHGQAGHLRIRSSIRFPSCRKEPTPLDAYVGARIRMRRNLLGISQTELGERIGVTFQQVQKYEKGVNRIGASRLMQICTVLEITPAWVFEGGPGPKPKPTAAARDIEAALILFQGDNTAPRLITLWPALPTQVKRRLIALMAALVQQMERERSSVRARTRNQP